MPEKRARISRLRVAQLLGVSRSYVQLLTEQGTFHNVTRDQHGAYLYDLREVQLIAIKRNKATSVAGQQARAAFTLFKTRTPFEDIVIELAMPPDEVHALWEWYKHGFALPSLQQKEAQTERNEDDHAATMRRFQEQMEERRQRRIANSSSPDPDQDDDPYPPKPRRIVIQNLPSFQSSMRKKR